MNENIFLNKDKIGHLMEINKVTLWDTTTQAEASYIINQIYYKGGKAVLSI